MSEVTKNTKLDHPFWRYWRSMTPVEREAFAKDVGSSVNTLRQIPEHQISPTLAKKISAASGIDKHYFRPDLWDLPSQEGQSTTD